MHIFKLFSEKLLRSRSYVFLLCAGLASCKSGPVNLFKASSPHEQYRHKLESSGLAKTAMGSAWIGSSTSILPKALQIALPFEESGYFAAERVPAAAYRFNVKQGEKIKIELQKKPDYQFMIYMDLWEESADKGMKFLTAADTIGNQVQFDAKNSGSVVLRLQPELLRSGQYTLRITSGPSLGFPVKSANSNNIQSLYGVGRDANTRKHEGIDIFASFRTPAIAAAEGTVVRVNENNLGGKVVWLRPKDKDYTLYYAHLDLQIATEGQQVSVGDTLGLVGNTGNAKTTAPHLHFGIYGQGGTFDPYPYVNTRIRNPQKITASLENLNSTMRTRERAQIYSSAETGTKSGTELKSGTIVNVSSAHAGWYKVELPDGKMGFVSSKTLAVTSKPLKKIRLKNSNYPLLDRPDSLAASRLILSAGTDVELLGYFDQYQLVRNDNNDTGWVEIR